MQSADVKIGDEVQGRDERGGFEPAFPCSDESRRSTFAAGFLARPVEACRPLELQHPYPPSKPPHISHHAVQTFLARRFGNCHSTVLTRPLPPTANTTARRPFCAPPLQTLRSPRAVRQTHTSHLNERTLQLTRSPGYATTNTDIFKPTKFGGKYTVTLIPGMRRAKIRANLQGGTRLRLYDYR
jgi:hypothetical protein